MRTRLAPPCFAVLCAIAPSLTVTPLTAQCRTPIPGPTTPGPATPQAAPPAVLTAPRSAQTNFNYWDVWWELHKHEFLGVQRPARRSPLTPQDPRGDDGMVAPADPELQRLRDDIVRPALREVLKSGPEIMAPQAVIALARLGSSADGVALQREVTRLLSSPDAQTRELAAMAMGLGGWPGAADTLMHLFVDDREGRKLCGKSRVSDRMRAFAGYGLGLLAQSTDDLETKIRVFEALGTALQMPPPDRNVASAATTGVGMLGLDAERDTGHKRLAWRGAAALRAFSQSPQRPGDQLAQAHALLATARLIGRGDGPEQAALGESCLRYLDRRRSKSHPFSQSAALTLGRMAASREERPADARYSDALLDAFSKHSDEQTRSFCLIALGRIGGASNRNELLKILSRGNKGLVKPWAALALGVLAFNQANPVPDETIGRALLNELRDIRTPEALGALAIATGLSGYQPAGDTLLQLLEKTGHRELVAPHVAVALGLLKHDEAVPALRELLADSLRRPRNLVGCAVALRELGDPGLTPLLLGLLEEAKKNAVLLGAVAVALEQTGDRRAIEPLVRFLLDDDRASLPRAYGAMALGGIAAVRDDPWYSEIGEWVNYGARVETLIQ